MSIPLLPARGSGEAYYTWLFRQNGGVRASPSNSLLGHSNIPLQGNSLANYG
jgi:hypothetical protein